MGVVGRLHLAERRARGVIQAGPTADQCVQAVAFIGQQLALSLVADFLAERADGEQFLPVLAGATLVDREGPQADLRVLRKQRKAVVDCLAKQADTRGRTGGEFHRAGHVKHGKHAGRQGQHRVSAHCRIECRQVVDGERFHGADAIALQWCEIRPAETGGRQGLSPAVAREAFSEHLAGAFRIGMPVVGGFGHGNRIVQGGCAGRRNEGGERGVRVLGVVVEQLLLC
ncbi:Uncharacterised protein [Mycobacteroides abscessus subsp. abscessus]|nr:Uncharacterised protein [Mycobacteroides abscessus subsp. abscessus]